MKTTIIAIRRRWVRFMLYLSLIMIIIAYALAP
jgi:hypothetical protein